mmetsp:Transcript_100878/g.314480  ORF Transcript_100878/g.314480 Transcript_100878/m.314480 type:complete len:249 (-) Transcript_100878:170-916(-)
MSYTTMNRYGEVKHTYNAVKSTGFVQGAWWPDFGPMSYDYSYQEKMHPTNTIFNNVIDRHRNRPEVEVVADRMVQGAAGASRSSSSRPAASPQRQFRRPLPATEALYKSTIIQPYKSGGRGHGNLGKGREGSWYERPDPPSSPTSLEGSFSAQLDASPLGARLAALRRSSSAPMIPSPANASLILSSPGLRTPDTGRSSASGAVGQSLPSWVASQTLMSRSSDAAGQNGAPKMQGGTMRVRGDRFARG